MRDPLSSTIKSIQPSGIRKFFDIVSEMKDAISLGVGEPDFDTPWHIRDEGIYSLEKGRTFYTSNAGLKELKIEISRYLDRRYGMTYDYNKEIMVTVGGSEAIDIALRAMLDPGDEVIIPQPSYVSYVPCTVLAGGTPVIVELKEENDFRLTAEEACARYSFALGHTHGHKSEFRHPRAEGEARISAQALHRDRHRLSPDRGGGSHLGRRKDLGA